MNKCKVKRKGAVKGFKIKPGDTAIYRERPYGDVVVTFVDETEQTVTGKPINGIEEFVTGDAVIFKKRGIDFSKRTDVKYELADRAFVGFTGESVDVSASTVDAKYISVDDTEGKNYVKLIEVYVNDTQIWVPHTFLAKVNMTPEIEKQVEKAKPEASFGAVSFVTSIDDFDHFFERVE